MRAKLLALVFMLGIGATAYAEIGYTVNCTFETSNEFRDKAIAEFIRNGQGIEVPTLQRGLELALKIVNTGDMNLLIAEAKTGLVLKNPEVIENFVNYDSRAEEPYRACLVSQGTVEHRFVLEKQELNKNE